LQQFVNCDLVVQRARRTAGERLFSVAPRRARNVLPTELKRFFQDI